LQKGNLELTSCSRESQSFYILSRDYRSSLLMKFPLRVWNSVAVLLCLLATVPAVLAQTGSPSLFDQAGIPGAQVYSDMKAAVKDGDAVYKCQFINAPFDPKLLPKITRLTNLQCLAIGANGVSQLPLIFTGFRGLLYFSSFKNAFTELPPEIGALQSLMYLELSDTKLSVLPASFSELSRLKSFQLQNNGADTFRLPSTVGELTALTDLVLDHVNLDSLPPAFTGLSKLQHLYLDHTRLKVLPRSFGKLTQLQSLVLDNCQLTELPKSFFKLGNLGYLSLKNNRIVHISDYICYLTNLAELDLSGNPISEQDRAILHALLPGCRIIYQ